MSLVDASDWQSEGFRALHERLARLREDCGAEIGHLHVRQWELNAGESGMSGLEIGPRRGDRRRHPAAARCRFPDADGGDAVRGGSGRESPAPVRSWPLRRRPPRRSISVRCIAAGSVSESCVPTRGCLRGHPPDGGRVRGGGASGGGRSSRPGGSRGRECPSGAYPSTPRRRRARRSDGRLARCRLGGATSRRRARTDGRLRTAAVTAPGRGVRRPHVHAREGAVGSPAHGGPQIPCG